MPNVPVLEPRREWTEDCRVFQHRHCQHIGSARTYGLAGHTDFVTICGCPCHWGCPSEEVSLPEMSSECLCSENGEVRQENFERFAKRSAHRAVAAAKVNFRPAIGWRIVCWAMIIFGLIFGAAGVAYLDRNAAGSVLMIWFGAMLVITMLGLATALVTADDIGVTYRNVWARQVIAASDIASIEVRERRGFAYGRTGVVVAHRSRKPLRLTALDRPSNPSNQARARAEAEEIANAVGIRPDNA